MDIKTKLALIAVVFIVAGFGILHAHNQAVSNTGSILIGVGTAYLIALLWITNKKQPSK